MTQVDWDAVAAFDKALSEADPIVQEAMEASRLRWNNLLFKLADLAKPGVGYEGEDSEELLALLAKRLPSDS